MMKKEQPANNFTTTANRIAELVTEKNKQYGDAVGSTSDFLKNLYPNGIQPHQYDDLGIIIRMYDKLKRVANGDQGQESAWDDLMGYSLLKASRRR